MKVILATLTLFAAILPAKSPAAGLDTGLSCYNVIWESPSKDASGSMPIGNGEVGLNVWVEADGDLLFYIARTDAWSESNRLMKLGRVRVHLSPNPFAAGQKFRQELKLRDGMIVINAGDTTLRLFVDADAPVVFLDGHSKTPRTLSATYETWRNERHRLTKSELESSWTMLDAPSNIEVRESADVVKNSPADTVLVYHRNESSVVPFTLKKQGIESLASLVKDPLVNRTFGARMSGADMVADDPNSLKTRKDVTEFSLTIATHSAQTTTPEEWEKQITQPVTTKTAAQRTTAYWNSFWDRSWIFVDGDPSSPDKQRTDSKGAVVKAEGNDSLPPSHATQAYILQRWITACAGRGNYPIKFNGSIFTVDPKFSGGPDLNADWRRWGDCYWWQNSRLPYFPMIARGDYDELRPLFRMFCEALPLCEARAKLYHNVSGAYFPETMTIFGTYANRDYGWDRTGHKPNEIQCPFWQYAWQQGLELTALMLDYYEHTGDRKFLSDELIPMANAVLRYYDTRFQRDAKGKLIINPAQAVETYWFGVTNDLPSVAGLTDVCARLLKLQASEKDHAYWEKMQSATPAIPIKDGCIQPAEKFNPERHNCENPELYALWPFRLYGVGRPDLATGIETFHKRIEKASFGWQYDGQSAAILGLASEARDILLGKILNSHAAFRFPAMWGPNYDWLPDQDHGSNIMLTLQNMVLQSDGEKIHVLPAWPKEWNVSFKLHAAGNTTVEGVYRGGKLEDLKVTPESRRKDVITGS